MSVEYGYNFSYALDMLKAGKRFARAGWNGKNMYIVLVHPYAPHPDDVDGSCSTTNPYFRAADNKDANVTLLPWIGMKTADNGFVPWLASQTDLLATDWIEV